MLPDGNAWSPLAVPPERRSRAGLFIGLIVGLVLIVLIAAAAALVISRSNLSAEGGWLASDTSGAVFLQVTDADGQLAGSAQIWRPDDDLGPTGASESYSLTGLRSSDSLSISLSGPLGASITWTGSIRGDELTLQIASDDGALRPTVFRRSSVADFNAVVATGQAAASERQTLAEQQEQATAEQNRLAEAIDEVALADQRVVADLERLNAAIDELEGVDLQPQIDEMERQLQLMRGQLDRVLATSECVAQSDALVALGDGRVALGDADVARRDVEASAEAIIRRTGIAADDLNEHLLELDAAIGRAGVSAPPTTISDTLARERLDVARSSINAVSEHLDEMGNAAAGLLAEGESLLDEGEEAIRSCSSASIEPAPAPAAPTAPDAPDAP